MSSGLDKAIKDFIQIIREAGNKGTAPLDAQAEVLRIDEDGTAWVHLPGGVDETPVKLTINAEVGDKVHVRLSGGRAWITGNQTSPPTDDKTAKVAKSLANIAGNRAKTAQKTADQAQIVADSALKGTKENAAQMAQMVLDFNGDIENLQDQIDGNIATWFYDVDPAMNLPPVTDWDTDEKKDAHLGDIYYNTVKGYAWRFMKSGSTYSWERITDTDVTKALSDAAKAQDTADSKRRVFYTTPTVPYDAGDLWVQGSGGDILRCAQAKKSTGSYDRNDWVLASKYTDNSALNAWIEGDFATTIQELEEGLVDAKVETYYQTTDPSTGWSDTQKSEHKGDLWYNSTVSVQKYYRWSGTAWQELTATPPQAVFDSIDKKATIYTGTTTPTNPDSGDLWFKGADEPILTYVNNSWVEYNKYTDDSAALAAQTSINNLEIGGRNLIVERNISNGWVNSSGTLTNSSGYIATDYIPVTPGDTIVFQLWTPSSVRSWIDDTYFDSDKNYVTGYNGEYIDSKHIIKLYTVPSGVSYVRISYSWADGYKAKLEKGNKATDWTPAPEDVDAGISEAQGNALSAEEASDALDGDLDQFKSNEYSQINDKVGDLVNYKDDNEKVIANIKDELSQELVAKNFAKIENGSLILGETNGTTAVLQNEQFGFYTPNSEVPASYFGKDNDAWAFSIERGIIKNDLRFSGFQWIARSNKNMSLKWIK